MTLDHPLPAAPEQLEELSAEGLGERRTPGFIRSAILTQPAALVGLAVLFFFVFIAIFGSYLEPYSIHDKTGPVYAPPSSAHWLGTDDGGVDMLSLLIAGTRVSMEVGFAAALVAMLIGGAVGVISGFVGGIIDVVLMRITDIFLVIPDIPLMIVMAAIFGRSLKNIIIIIGIIYWTSTARLIRAQVKSVRERVYVKRARSLGATNNRLVFKHVLPQVAPLLIANTVLTVAVAIFDETALSFLGLGDPSAISLGKVIENAFERAAISSGAWWAIVPPGILVALIILSCSLIGGALEDSLNPRLRVAHLGARTFRLRPLVGRSPEAL